MPRRVSFYVMFALLIVLGGLVFYMTRVVNSPQVQQAVEKARQQAAATHAEPVIPVTTTPSVPPPAAKVDPELQRKADELFSPDQPPKHDLEIVHDFLDLYNRAFKNGFPVGLNEDITAALTGLSDPSKPGGFVFPRDSKAIRNGQLIDRWGSPLWFHPETSTKMEIRSAGPDKNLFTEDDVILKP